MDQELMRHFIRLIRHFAGEHEIDHETYTDQTLADLFTLAIVDEETHGPVNFTRLYPVVATTLQTLNENRVLI